MPPALTVEQAVEDIQRLLASEEGATYSLYFGAVGNHLLYAVSLYPERGRKLPGKSLSTTIVRAFIRQNHDLLRDPRNCVGVWYDKENGITYLDISAILKDREDALQLGREYNQIGVYDFEQAEVIETGGMGEEIENLPPIKLRLPPLERLEQDGDNHRNGNSDSS